MTEILTASQIRALEQAAIDSGAVTGRMLMERAGAAVLEAVFARWPGLRDQPGRAVVLCGPGNNGGDGFVVARQLQGLGWAVEVYLHGDPARLAPDAAANAARWRALGAICSFPDHRPDPAGATLIVDALFGIGLARPLSDHLIAAMRDCLPGAERKPGDDPPHVVAIDIPSGLCAETGAPLPWAVPADLTVSFHAPKPGHLLDRGPTLCGALRVMDIGLPVSSLSKYACATLATKPGPDRLGKGAGHKFSHGHALVLSGAAGRTGAARLAARGALRIGAGLVTLGVPGAAQLECATHLTAIMLARIEDGAALAAVLQDRRFTALCLGPGLGLTRARDLVPVAVRAEHAPYVLLDADALTAFEGRPEALFALLHPGCVLTPHGGEFARLFPDLAARLGSDPAWSKLDATRAAAARAGCTVLFKGPDTVIADATGRAVIHAGAHDRAAPWLATAGSGDVLAGFIAGLMARGLQPMNAADIGAWLHVDCARSFGPGLIAEDLPEELPRVFRALGL